MVDPREFTQGRLAQFEADREAVIAAGESLRREEEAAGVRSPFAP